MIYCSSTVPGLIHIYIQLHFILLQNVIQFNIIWCRCRCQFRLFLARRFGGFDVAPAANAVPHTPIQLQAQPGIVYSRTDGQQKKKRKKNRPKESGTGERESEIIRLLLLLLLIFIGVTYFKRLPGSLFLPPHFVQIY